MTVQSPKWCCCVSRFRNSELKYFGFSCAAAAGVAFVVEDGLRTVRLRRRRRGVSLGALSILVRSRDVTRLLPRVARVLGSSFRRVGDPSSFRRPSPSGATAVVVTILCCGASSVNVLTSWLLLSLGACLVPVCLSACLCKGLLTT
jgi:hypothetical protein